MFLDSMNDPKTLLRKTVTLCAVLLAAWAALIGTVTLVMLVAISSMKSGAPAPASVQSDAQPSPDAVPTTSPKSDAFRPTRAPAPKSTTRI